MNNICGETELTKYDVVRLVEELAKDRTVGKEIRNWGILSSQMAIGALMGIASLAGGRLPGTLMLLIGEVWWLVREAANGFRKAGQELLLRRMTGLVASILKTPQSRYRMSESEIVWERANATIAVRRNECAGLVETNEHIFIICHSVNPIIVPKRAFGSREEWSKARERILEVVGLPCGCPSPSTSLQGQTEKIENAH